VKRSRELFCWLVVNVSTRDDSFLNAFRKNPGRHRGLYPLASPEQSSHFSSTTKLDSRFLKSFQGCGTGGLLVPPPPLFSYKFSEIIVVIIQAATATSGASKGLDHAF
jgi:hypothetical protein